MKFLFLLFFFSMSLAAEDDDLSSGDIYKIKSKWQQFLKEKRLSKSEAAKVLFSYSKNNKEFYFSRAFKPEQKTAANGEEKWFGKT